MRKIIVSSLVSADGFFEGTQQNLSWFKIDPEFARNMAIIFSRVDPILIGRKFMNYSLTSGLII